MHESCDLRQEHLVQQQLHTQQSKYFGVEVGIRTVELPSAYPIFLPFVYCLIGLPVCGFSFQELHLP
jgi:hypothetical protein